MKLYHRGKVRDIYEFQDKLLIVATDRISAFDCVLPNLIPFKGQVLTQLTEFWLQRTASLVPNHRLATRLSDFPHELQSFREQLLGRSMLVVRARPFPVECVVRGYLAGSAWSEYKASGTINGEATPRGLQESQQLATPMFTPTTKASAGHDMPMTMHELFGQVGKEVANELKRLSLAVYQAGHEYALTRGILIADTKFEFGMLDGKLILIDECLTPDSSRFWAADAYKPGRAQDPLDKQFVRDWLNASGWNKEPPGPVLPPDVVEQTARRYQDVYQRLTGHPLPAVSQ